VVVPDWFLVVAFLLLPGGWTVSTFRRCRRRRRSQLGQCSNCGYSLQCIDMNGKCPECGQTIQGLTE
jgi:ribosomal protein L34E